MKIKYKKCSIKEMNEKLEVRLPWFRDPRKLNRKSLLKAVEEYGIDPEEVSRERKSSLVRRLYSLMLEEGNRNPLVPEVMNDKQPEKWYLLAERFHKSLFELSEESERRTAMEEANKMLSGLSIDELIEVGNGDCIPEKCKSNVEVLACRLVSALTLEPHFEREGEMMTGNEGWIRCSVTIAGNYNGHTRIPAHLEYVS